MTTGGWDVVRTAVGRRVGEAAFDAWFRTLDGTLEGETLVLRCPDRFTRDWLRSRFGRVIEECAQSARAVEYRLAAGSAAPPEVRRVAALPELAEAACPQEQLFDSFISGPASALALEAARAVARGEAGRCNPLFLVGGTGMGKTHLCRAIYGRAANAASAVYRSSEEFTTEVTEALRAGQMPKIRQRYRRQANLLILEDVQFLAGKRATQAELFHTLDHLVERGKTVVFTADRGPSELDELDPKLRSASGLVARIGPPERDTRRAILRERAARGGVRVPDACVELLADRELASVRDVIAGLNQVVARASLLRAEITPELVAQALDAVELPGRARSLDEIVAETARAYGQTPEALRSRSRKQLFVRPRQVAMYLARRYTDASLAEIGRAFSRDHTSVMYAIDVVERRIVEKPQLRYELDALAQRISGRAPSRSASGSTRGTRPT
jgi:chromosomal replication initiator protein